MVHHIIAMTYFPFPCFRTVLLLIILPLACGYKIDPFIVLWRPGQTMEEGISRIFSALQAGPTSTDVEAETLTGADWNAWYASVFERPLPPEIIAERRALREAEIARMREMDRQEERARLIARERRINRRTHVCKMPSFKLVPILSILILALTASVRSYEINAAEQLWRAGQSLDDGVANLSEHIGNALRRNTNAINPEADAPQRFFNHLNQQGRLGEFQPSFLSAKIMRTDLE
ncbi:hypothetical protein PHBOTO_002804 [Pseudozyma hubeiensis]|nr:hypothetical protein PHBOTO_002804 [Pseudozyma hubeiensis]